MINVGNKITILRKEQNLTTNKLANMSGISQSFLRDIELGKKNPTIETLFYICTALNITLKDFFSEEESKINPILLNVLSKYSNDEQLKLAQFLEKIK